MRRADRLTGPPARHHKNIVVSALGITQMLAWASTYYLAAVFTDPMSADLKLSPIWFYGSVSAALLLTGSLTGLSFLALLLLKRTEP